MKLETRERADIQVDQKENTLNKINKLNHDISNKNKNVNNFYNYTQQKNKKEPQANDFITFSKFYISKNFSIHPLAPRDKVPFLKGSWREIHLNEHDLPKYYNERICCNIGIKCGFDSNNLIVLDFDNENLIKFFEEKSVLFKKYVSKTWKVKTGRGLHVYLRVNTTNKELLKAQYIEFEHLNVKLEIKGNGTYVVAPPSIHPHGEIYEFQNDLNNIPFPIVIEEKEWKEILNEIESLSNLGNKTKESNSDNNEEDTKIEEKNKIKDEKVEKLIEILNDDYIEGNRDFIIMYLSGYLRKLNWDYEKTKELIIKIIDEFDDEEKNMRLKVVERAYNLNEKELKGFSGLIEILGDEKAKKISEVFENSTTNDKDFKEENTQIIQNNNERYLCIDFDSNLKIAFVIDKKQYIVYTAKKLEDKKYSLKMPVFAGYPLKIQKYVDPLHGGYLYSIMWKTAQKSIANIPPKKLSQVTSLLLNEYGVGIHGSAKNNFYMFLSAIEKNGHINVEYTYIKPGIYFIQETKDFTVRYPYNAYRENITEETLKKSIVALLWFKNKFRRFKIRFDIAILWGLAAPFAFCKKQLKTKIWLKHLFLVGDRQVGKSSLGVVVCSLYRNCERIGGSSIDTIARLGEYMESSTFPILVDEPRAVFEKANIQETFKSATELIVAREKFIEGEMTKILSLAPFCFASNRPLPKDQALQHRFLQLQFFKSEAPTENEKEVYIREVEKYLPYLKILGALFLEEIRTSNTFKKEILNAENIFEPFAKRLIRLLRYFKFPYGWVENALNFDEKELQEEIEENQLELFRVALIERIRKEASTNLKEELSNVELIEHVLNKKAIPFCFSRNNQEVIITRGILKFLEQHKLNEWAISLTHLANHIPNAKNVIKKIDGKNKRVIKVPLDKFVKFLSQKIED